MGQETLCSGYFSHTTNVTRYQLLIIHYPRDCGLTRAQNRNIASLTGVS